MSSQKANGSRFSTEKQAENNLFRDKDGFYSERDNGEQPAIEFTLIMRKILLSIKKLFVASKYQLHKLTKGALADLDVPYFKIAVCLLLAYLMFNKDFRFTVNMNAPSALLPADEKNSRGENVAEMGIAQAVAHHEEIKNPFAEAAGDDAKTKKEKKYIRRFQKTARQEAERFGIPASVKMAQGLLESGAGHSGLAQRNNNHFGIKCFSKKCGKGHCSNHSDDHHKDFFVKYKSDWESWRAHSELLSTKHYKALKEHGTDYEAWAYGLKKAGYATDPRYPEKLIQKIEKYKLYLLDK